MPWSNTIADILQQQGEQGAATARAISQIASTGALNRGRIISGAINDVGQAISTLPYQRAKLREEDEQSQLRQLTAQQATGRIHDEEAARQKSAQIQGILQKHGDDLPSAITEIMGVDAGAALELNKHYTESVNAGLTFRKTQLDYQQKQREFYGGLLTQATDPGGYNKARLAAINAGVASADDLPQDFEQAQPQLKALERSLLTADQRAQEDRKALEDQQKRIDQQNQEANRLADNARLDAQMRETERSNKAREGAANRRADAAEKAANPFASMGAGTGQAGGAQGPTGEEFLKNFAPAEAAQIRQLAEGRQPFPAGMAMSRLQPLIQAVSQYDPSFDATNYNARNKARTDLMSPNGQGGKTINALNTALQHAGTLSDLIEKLDNYGSPLANVVVNPLRTAAGKTEVTNFKAVAPQLMKEIERAWRGTGGSTADIQDLIDSLSSNLGKQQQREALAKFAELVKGKLDSTQQQRDNVMGPIAAPKIPVLFDQNKAALDKIESRAQGAPTKGSVSEGTEGTVNGVPAVWKTVNGQAGWYAR